MLCQFQHRSIVAESPWVASPARSRIPKGKRYGVRLADQERSTCADTVRRARNLLPADSDSVRRFARGQGLPPLRHGRATGSPFKRTDSGASAVTMAESMPRVSFTVGAFQSSSEDMTSC